MQLGGGAVAQGGRGAPPLCVCHAVRVCMCACACHARVALQLPTHSPLPEPQRCNVHIRTQPHTLQPNRPNDRTRPSAQVLRLSELPFYDLAGLLTPLIASSLGAPAASVRSFLHLNERAACRTRQLGAAATRRPPGLPDGSARLALGCPPHSARALAPHSHPKRKQGVFAAAPRSRI